MRASRSRTWARNTGRIAPLSLLMLLTLLALVATRAFGATPTKRTASPDTTSDEGFRVRVVEEGSGSSHSARLSASHEARLRAEARERAKAGLPALDKPEPPDTPEPPEPPDTDLDINSGDNGLVRFGEDITIPEGKTIDGDVVAIGGTVTVYGRVKGDCVAIGGGVDIRDKGVVEGDAVSMGGGVSTSDSASVGGKNVSIGSSPLGHGHFWPMVGLFGAVGTGIWIMQALVKLLLTLFFAWVVLLLARDRVLRSVEQMYLHFGKSFLWGLLGFAVAVVALPMVIIVLILVSVIAIVILAITIIGIPVAILLVIALVLAIVGLCLSILVAAFVGFLNGALFLGQRVLGRGSSGAQNPMKAIAVGLLVLTALKIAGKLMALVGLLVFHPIAIALGIASGALCVILTIAGFGALLTAGGSYRLGSIRAQWWPPSRHAATPPTPTPTPGTTASPPPATPDAGKPEPPPEGGSSDAP